VQAQVSCQLPTAAAPVPFQPRGIYGGQRGRFLRVIRFPLTTLIPPIAPYSLIILASTLYSLDNASVVKQATYKAMYRAIAQAVSRWLPTAAARVRSRVWSSGICGAQSGAGAGFPCQSSFHQLLHNHPHLSSGAGTIGQKWSQYKGLSPTPLALKESSLLGCGAV
jgi:hypothetical protein